MYLKKIFCWPPLLAGAGAAITIIILGYITYESILSDTNYGLWLFASFGSTVVLVFGFPNNEFAQPKNIFFGHLLTSIVGVIFVNFIPLPIYIMIPIAVGIGVSLMILTSVTHPPAGGNPIIVIIGSASFDYIVSPIIIGSALVLVFGVILNRFILKKQYPKK